MSEASKEVQSKAGFECKHALYFTANDGSENDLLLVKEYKTDENGVRTPNLRQLYNYERPFWITVPAYRNHKDKKEWEEISKLKEMKSTEKKLAMTVARALGTMPGPRMDMRTVAQSPYIYGTDASSALLVKNHYLRKWPNHVSKNTVAVIDSETDMTKDPNEVGYGDIIMLSITMGSKAKIVIVESYLAGVADPEQQLREKFAHYLSEVPVPHKNPKIKEIVMVDLPKERNINLEIKIVANSGDCVNEVIQTAHEWQPDILAAWNIDFDFPKMITSLERYGYDPAQVFSDPRIPREFRQYEYKQGAAKKKTASGKEMALAPAERWHEVIAPASFYVLDPMCVYLKLRIAGGKEPSYGLDAILKKHKLGGKLKFEAADNVGSGGAWHKFMQTYYKIEYCVYNLYDCIAVELLDEITTDLQSMVSLMCDHSPYHRFPSQPKRTCDDLHFLALENGLVCASTSNKMMDDNDPHVVEITDWIVTLPSHLVEDDGLCLLQETPEVRSNVRAHVADLDVEGTYPNVEIIMNISKETTAQELCYIRDVHERVRRSVGINLSGGYVNAVEIAQQIYKAPGLDAILAEYDRQQALAA